MLKVVTIIQARMGSTRLPGKVLKKVLNKTLLEYQIERISQSKLLDEIIIATTTNKKDEPIVDLCKKLGVSYFRGSEIDVLGRFYKAAITAKADVIVRLTADCPIIDHKVMDKVIDRYLHSQEVIDYVSNTLERTYPRGMDTEVFSFPSLKKAHEEAILAFQREHVTPFIVHNPERFRLENIKYKVNASQHRWTVDTIEDFLLIKKIIEELYPTLHDFTLEDTLELLRKYPEWPLINGHIEQKRE
jgi:spore coat polysaccharide biosynthesis protein SpsF